MPSKIAGFILSATQVDYVPLVNRDLKTKTVTGPWGFLTFYSVDEEILPVSDKIYSLGFPQHQSLLHHNLLLTLKEREVIIENDWIGGIPVYYNASEKVVSTFPEVCIGNSPKIDDEGLYLFLKYGFSALETTPFAGVLSLRYYSALRFSARRTEVTEKKDPALSVDLSQPASEEEIWELLTRDIENVLDNTSGFVVSPMSGGYDSRIINALIPDRHKSRVRTYSYGLSPEQSESFEARIAKLAAEQLGIKWKHIYLNKAFDFMEEWHDIFGFGTHLHGMMHIEFYQKIMAQLAPSEAPAMFSGISGSAFQGGHPPGKHATRPGDLYDVALTHGLNCNAFIPQRETEAEEKFFEQNRELLSNLKWYPVNTMRIKMNLLHYLYKLPVNMGISSTSPYHNFEIVTKMLSLPEARRANRKWVSDFFRKRNLDFGKRSKYGDTRNTLNRQFFMNHKFDPLDEKLFKETSVSRSLIDKVNSRLQNVGTLKEKTMAYWTSQRVIKELLKKLGVKNELNTYLFPYFTLKAIEKSLKKHQF